MGERGPPSQPTQLKILHGNPGRRKLNSREPKPTAGCPSCPSWLNAEAKAEWKRQTEVMPAGLMTMADRGALAMYCQAWSEFVEASKFCKQITNHWITTDKGNLVLHPASLVLQRSHERATRLAAQFGFTPSARSRLEMPPQDKKSNPLQEHLKRGRSS